jgi:hypothetical protein
MPPASFNQGQIFAATEQFQNRLQVDSSSAQKAQARSPSHPFLARLVLVSKFDKPHTHTLTFSGILAPHPKKLPPILRHSPYKVKERVPTRGGKGARTRPIPGKLVW